MINITNLYIDKKLEGIVSKVLSSKFIVQGEKVKELENKLCEINKTKYSVVVNSGTAALHTALASIGLKEGDEVITTTFSFIATVNTILMCGAKPVFVDIDKATFNIKPHLIEKKITYRTKAILTVDLYGQSCDYEKIAKIAHKYKLKIIADSCQAIGVLYKNKPISKWVDIVCFSFYATKNVMMGEGGALVTDNKKIWEFAKRFRQHGQDMERPYIYHHPGYNYRSTDILASIGLYQLNFLRAWNEKRFTNAQKLMNKIKDIKGIIIPRIPKKGEHVFHQFTIMVSENFKLKRDQLRDYLISRQIKTGIYYPSILPSQPFLRRMIPYRKGMYPVAEECARQVLSLPVHPMLKDSDINKIAYAIKRATHEKK